MNLEFQSTLFPTRVALCEAVAEAWITACGSNSAADIREICTAPVGDLVSECVEAWDLWPEWLEERGITRADLLEAFSSFVDAKGRGKAYLLPVDPDLAAEIDPDLACAEPEAAAAAGRYLRNISSRWVSNVWSVGGREYYRNKRGMCEDAPCCGCCSL
jgi:hypothetical protein